MVDKNPPIHLFHWSRRKLSARTCEEPVTGRVPTPEPIEGSALAEAEEELQRAVLRALFREPPFAMRDGLDDYDGDYTYFEPRGELMTYDLMKSLERLAQAEKDYDAVQTGIRSQAERESDPEKSADP